MYKLYEDEKVVFRSKNLKNIKERITAYIVKKGHDVKINNKMEKHSPSKKPMKSAMKKDESDKKKKSVRIGGKQVHMIKSTRKKK